MLEKAGARLIGSGGQFASLISNNSLGCIYRRLRGTGRGKHVGSFSYYHKSVVAELPEITDGLGASLRHIHQGKDDFNVIKLDARSRLSFLWYEDFSVSFPALLLAISCDLARNVARQTDYSMRRNPPILHRKELLLCADDPLVPAAVRLTEQFEALGAFRDTSSIGTREGWKRRLLALGLDADGRRLT